MRKALKKITNAIKKTQLYRTRQEINEHIFGTKKDNGVTITLINTGKSKWGTQFNYAGIQHQTLDQYTGRV
jgi:hypothetical protein